MNTQHQIQQPYDVAPTRSWHKTLLLTCIVTLLFWSLPSKLPIAPADTQNKSVTTLNTEAKQQFTIQSLLTLWYVGREISPYLHAWINKDPKGAASALLEHHSIPKPLTKIFIQTLAKQSPETAAHYFFGEFDVHLSADNKLIAINLIYPQRPLLAAKILADGGLGNIGGTAVETFFQQAFSHQFSSAELMFLAEPKLLSVSSLKHLYLRSLITVDLASAFTMLDNFRRTSSEDAYAELSSTFIHDVKKQHHLAGRDLLLAIQQIADDEDAQVKLIKENLPELLRDDIVFISQALDDLPLSDIENRYVEGVLIETDWVTEKINADGPAFFLRYFDNDTNINLAWQKYILNMLSHDYQQALATLETMPAGRGRDAIIEHILMEDRNQYDRVFADLSYLISNDFERGILGNIY